MLIALDSNSNRINATDAQKGQDYFCPICNGKLELRKGSIRCHHFGHWKDQSCTETWSPEMSEWHYNWQCMFPEDCREVVLQNRQELHRADVLINNVVVEFQHSPMSPEEFQERNQFYTSAGHPIVWLFDLTTEVKKEKIIYSQPLIGGYEWKWSKTTFAGFNPYENDNITVFFQLYDEDGEEGCIKQLIHRNMDDKYTSYFRLSDSNLTKADFIELIQSGFFLIERNEPINELKHLIVPEGKLYRFTTYLILPTKKESIVRNEIIDLFSRCGEFISSPKSVFLTQDSMCGPYGRYFLEIKTINEASVSYEKIRNKFISIIENIPGVLKLYAISLRGRSIYQIFEDNPASGKGLINLSRGTKVYVSKTGVYKTITYGRLEKNGKYPGQNVSIFNAEKPEWIENFDYNG